jgi:putative acetyltransferase
VSSDSEIVFRSATNADCERVQDLVSGVLREYGLAPDPDGTDRDITDIETHYLKRGGVFEILENAEGNLLGTCGLYPLDDETIELRKMYFEKELRGRGYGKKLLERMIEAARSLGFKQIHLETHSALKEAIALYKKYGFEPTEEEKLTPRCDQTYFLELN